VGLSGVFEAAISQAQASGNDQQDSHDFDGVHFIILLDLLLRKTNPTASGGTKHPVSAIRACLSVLVGSSCRAPSGKMPMNLGHDLTVRHLVSRFNGRYPSSETGFDKPCFKLTLGFTWTQQQNGFRAADAGDDRGVIEVEMTRQGPLAAVVRGDQLRFKAALERGVPGTTELLFRIRYYQANIITLAGDRHNHGLLVVNPQTDP
jgi:hypothetical protein